MLQSTGRAERPGDTNQGSPSKESSVQVKDIDGSLDIIFKRPELLSIGRKSEIEVAEAS